MYSITGKITMLGANVIIIQTPTAGGLGNATIVIVKIWVMVKRPVKKMMMIMRILMCSPGPVGLLLRQIKKSKLSYWLIREEQQQQRDFTSEKETLHGLQFVTTNRVKLESSISRIIIQMV